MFSTLDVPPRPPAAAPAVAPDLPDDVRLALPMRFEAVGEALASRARTSPSAPARWWVVTWPATVPPWERHCPGCARPTSWCSARRRRSRRPRRCRWPGARRPWSTSTTCRARTRSPGWPAWPTCAPGSTRSTARPSSPTSAVAGSHALVIVELRFRGPPACRGHHFTRALRLVQVTEALRAVYSGGQTLGRLGLGPGRRRGAPRPSTWASRWRLLRDFLADLDLGDGRRPGLDRGAARLRRGPRPGCWTSWPTDRAASLTACVAATRRAVSPEDLVEEFEIDKVEVAEPLEPDYNVAPTKQVYAVVERPPRRGRDRPDPERQLRAADAGGWCRSGPRTPRSAAG